METIIIKNPIDMHIHLRQDELLKAVLPSSARYFSALLAMPNLNPPLMDTQSVLSYKNEIIQTMQTDSDYATHCLPIMSLYIHDDLSIEELQKAHKNGIKILKLYPKGATTNSDNGVSSVLNNKLLTLLQEAQHLNMILSIHGESTGFSMEREREFLTIFEELARNFPRLKIIIEHLSDRHSIESIHKFSNLFGTITLHHLSLTLDSILGGKLNPFAFCKPIVKTPQDRDAILECALSGDSKFSFGSDSAPHTIEAKMNGAAGIFQAPILLQALTTLFAKHDKISNLQAFLSDNAQKIYDINLPFTKTIILKQESFIFGEEIPCSIGNIKVFEGEKEWDYCINNIEITNR